MLWAPRNLLSRAGDYLGRRLRGEPSASPNPSSGLAAPRDEPSSRQRLLDSFLQASHGDLAALHPVHALALQQDPIFYGHLARWYSEHGSLRDHHELFAATSLASPWPEHRDQGEVLLALLRPYQVARVVRHSKETMHFATRRLRRAVRAYLARREAWPAWFDECVLRDRRSMKYLYCTLHLKAGPRARRILFDDDPPADSRLAVFRRLVRLADRPEEQARLLYEHRIPFTTALGAVRQLTPTVLYALVSVMTPQQAINHLAFLERRGALAEPRTRALVEEKIRQGARESRVADCKTLAALQRLQGDEALAGRLLEMTGQRLRHRGRIQAPTALFIDKSGSMEQAIEAGKMLACLCSTVADGPLHVLAFDSHAFPIVPRDRSFAAWHQAFQPIRADGCTSIGAPLQRLMDQRVEQIVLVTDGEENTAPCFCEVLSRYEKRHGLRVRLFLLRIGRQGPTALERSLRGRDLTVLPFQGDYYNLPNLVPLLCAGSGYELVEEILSYPLYTREDLDHLPPGFDEETCEIL